MKYSPIKLILAALMVVGIFSLPYGYYTFLRITASIVFGVSAYMSYGENKILTIIYAGLTILFQPIIPITFSKDIWIVIDVIVAIFLVVVWFVERRNQSL